jgi:hypothetical protein
MIPAMIGSRYRFNWSLESPRKLAELVGGVDVVLECATLGFSISASVEWWDRTGQQRDQMTGKFTYRGSNRAAKTKIEKRLFLVTGEEGNLRALNASSQSRSDKSSVASIACLWPSGAVFLLLISGLFACALLQAFSPTTKAV